jgi:dinuclear metal center YbgI/SA1388 family protein
MMNTIELSAYLNDYLDFPAFRGDVSNNGLQVEANPEVRKIVTGVDACMALFEAAKRRGADLIMVHHGMSWGGEPRRFTGDVGRRLQFLFNHRISLYAAHLPLDAHPVLGNNAILGETIGLENRQMFCCYDGADIGVRGQLPSPMTAREISEMYREKLGCAGTVYADSGQALRRIGCISGGAGHSGLAAALEAGLELLVTGAMEHELYHPALEAGLAVLALGHYGSETVGIKALGELTAEKFGLDVEFIDIPTDL